MLENLNTYSISTKTLKIKPRLYVHIMIYYFWSALMSYIDAMTYIIEERGMDYMNIKKLISPALKEKLTLEAAGLKLIKIKKKNSLPI